MWFFLFGNRECEELKKNIEIDWKAKIVIEDSLKFNGGHERI